MPSEAQIKAGALALCDCYGRNHKDAIQFMTRAEAVLHAAEKILPYGPFLTNKSQEQAYTELLHEARPLIGTLEIEK